SEDRQDVSSGRRNPRNRRRCAGDGAESRTGAGDLLVHERACTGSELPGADRGRSCGDGRDSAAEGTGGRAGAFGICDGADGGAAGGSGLRETSAYHSAEVVCADGGVGGVGGAVRGGEVLWDRGR